MKSKQQLIDEVIFQFDFETLEFVAIKLGLKFQNKESFTQDDMVKSATQALERALIHGLGIVDGFRAEFAYISDKTLSLTFNWPRSIAEL